MPAMNSAAPQIGYHPISPKLGGGISPCHPILPEPGGGIPLPPNFAQTGWLHSPYHPTSPKLGGGISPATRFLPNWVVAYPLLPDLQSMAHTSPYPFKIIDSPKTSVKHGLTQSAAQARPCLFNNRRFAKDIYQQ